MRILKITLADGNDYQLGTLTLKEQGFARKLEKLPKEEQDFSDICNKKIEAEEELTLEEQDKMDKLQDKQVRNLCKIIMYSIAKFNDEFKIGEKNSEKDILDKLENLLDLRDLKRLATFALLGTLPKDDEEEVEQASEVIDLTALVDKSVLEDES